MKKFVKKIALSCLLLVCACDLDKDLQNPNEVSVSGADVNLLMNAVQLDFADFFHNTSVVVDRLMRMEALTGGYRYQTAIQAQTLDALWTLAYQKVLVNAETLIPLAEEKKLTTHVAVAKILEAYVYLTLVDVFNDVPQANALKGPQGDFNPVASSGSDVYTYAIKLLGDAKIELAKTGTDAGAALARDIYYSGSRTKWNALANSLELKAWLNLSMIPSRAAEANGKINALLTSDLVDTEAENFTYKYGSTTVPPSRHPLYDQYYGPAEAAAAGYINNGYMYEMYNGKGVQDPRWRYYFYRQVGSISKALSMDPKSVGCTPTAIPDHYANGNFIYCTFEPGFFGRDHGNAAGTPPDSPALTAVGVYPAGGLIDTNPTSNTTFAKATKRGDGANGAGIQPIFMSFFTDYMKAEILARGGNVALAKTTLSAAINKSITQVKSFAASRGQTLAASLEPSTTAYVAAVESLFDNASNKLDVVGREFYAASWGNGIEAYNSYRRTSAPRNLQPAIQLNPGAFYRSLIYPAAYVNLNSSATQKNIDAVNKVFWDTNPDNLN